MSQPDVVAAHAAGVGDVCVQAPTLVPGAPCGNRADGVCTADHYCDGVCQLLEALGQSCVTSLECASRHCDNRVCSAVPLAEVCEVLRDPK